MLKWVVFLLVILAVALLGFLQFTNIGNWRLDASSTIKILGPGDRPSVCADRARAYFDRNEKVMREISDILLTSDRTDEVRVNLDRTFERWLALDGDDVEPTQVDFDTYFPLFEKLETGNIFTPSFFRIDEGDVYAHHSGASCGVKVIDWFKYRMGGDYFHGYPNADTGFVYSPNSDYELSICNEPIESSDTPVSCDIPLTDKWAVNSYWIMFDDPPLDKRIE